MRVGFTWILAATKTYSFRFPADLKGVCDLNFFIMGPVKPKTGKTPFIHYYSVLLLQSQHFTVQTPRKLLSSCVRCSWHRSQLDPELSLEEQKSGPRTIWNDLWNSIQTPPRKKNNMCFRQPCRLYSTSSALLIWDRIKEGNKIRASKPQSH